MSKNIKLYPDITRIGFPVEKNTKTIKFIILSHYYDGGISIPQSLILEFGVKFFIKNKTSIEKSLTNLTYSTYDRDNTGYALMNEEITTTPPTDCIGVDVYIKQTNQPVGFYQRSSNMLMNFWTEK